MTIGVIVVIIIIYENKDADEDLLVKMSRISKFMLLMLNNTLFPCIRTKYCKSLYLSGTKS